jgi:hypothetical protein
VTQLSLFSADLTPPQLTDLGGLLAAHGRLVGGPDEVRLSILLGDRWRASALVRECRVRDVPADISEPPSRGAPVDIDPATAEPVAPVAARAAGQPFRGILLGTASVAPLGALAAAWTQDGDKTVPADLVVTPGFLRCWILAAGRPAEIGYLLGLDSHAPDTYEPLAAACAAAGLAGSLLGVRGGGPAVRIVGHRRCTRLAEMIGNPPPEAPPHSFPVHGHP